MFVRPKLTGSVLLNEPVNSAPLDAVRTLQVLDALARSAREGRTVEVRDGG